MSTPFLARRFRFAVNTSGKDKNWDFKELATRYRDIEGTIFDVKRHVRNGHALCAGLLGGHRRKTANVLGSHWILLDIDNTDVLKDELGQPVKDENGKDKKIYKPELTLEAALANEFIQKHCALIYTTASHRPDWHKFRVVFLLPEYVEGADTVEACTRFLMQHLPHDPACKDASRVFYGNSKAEFPLVQPGATLPLDWVIQARETAQKERIEYAQRIKEIEERKKQLKQRADVEGWDTDALIQEALSFIPPRMPGSNNYEECRNVLMALVDYYGPAQAEAIASQWSPSIKGTTWNIPQKIRSFKRKGIKIGTLFHIAKQYGFKFPVLKTVQRRDEPDVKAYDEYLKREAELEQFEDHCSRHIELQQEDSFRSFFTNRLARLKKYLSRTRSFKGFGETPKDKTEKTDSGLIEFKEGEHYTTLQTLAQQAKTENKRLLVLDASEGGAGKSHLVGELTPQALGVNTIFYTSATHRNPSVASIEQNYTDLPVRHDGLVSDSTQLTPLGNPHVHWAKAGEEPNIEGNCSKTHLFHIFAAKGYKEVSTEAAINPVCNVCKWKSNCAGAADLPTIPRHTFRQERWNAMASDRIRCNLDSLPDIGKMQVVPEEENQEPKRIAVVVDEFTQFRGYSETQASLKDFDNTWMYLKSQVHNAESEIKELNAQRDKIQAQVSAKLEESEKLEAQLDAMTRAQQLDLGLFVNNSNTEAVQKLEAEIARLDVETGYLIADVVTLGEEINAIRDNIKALPAAISALEPIIFALRSILNGEQEVTSLTRFGWNEAAIRSMLGDLTGLGEHLAVIRSFTPKLGALLREADSVTLDGMTAQDRKGSAGTLKLARKAMQKEADEENRVAIANLPSNCLVPILEILLGEKQGSFRVTYKHLTIYTRDDRHREQLKQADFTLILDGTKTRESLAQDLDVDPSDIVVIRQKRKRHANLKIVQVTGMGLLGRDRAESMKARVKAITLRVQEQHGIESVGIIDHAACIADRDEKSESGYWFKDNRGSNRFENKTALLTFGSPFPNIGQLQLEYTTLTGDCNPDKDNAHFAAFVQERVQSEVAQSGWRLRSSRRSGEQLIWYAVTDQDLSYLREYFPDAELEVKTAFQINPHAGSLGEQTYWTILEASKQVIESGRKLTTEAIANIVGCNRSRISQIAKDVVGGFAAFRRVLMFLLKSLYRTINTPQSDPDALTEDELFAAKTYLPLVLSENVQTPENGVSQVMSAAQSLGKESFERVLQALTFKDKAQLLAQMLTLLPEEWQQEFLELGRLAMPVSLGRLAPPVPLGQSL